MSTKKKDINKIKAIRYLMEKSDWLNHLIYFCFFFFQSRYYGG